VLAEGKRVERVPRRWCPVGTKKRKKRAGSELGRGFEVKSSIGRRSSEGIRRTEYKAPLTYRPTSFRPSRQGHGSVSDRVPTPRGVERVEVTRGHPTTVRLDAPYPWGLGRVVAYSRNREREESRYAHSGTPGSGSRRSAYKIWLQVFTVSCFAACKR
jgi:hypothetical protein